MMQEDYNNLVNSLATKLLEEGPEEAADNAGGPSTPNVPEEDVKKDSNLLDKMLTPYHFGEHGALKGQTSGTGKLKTR